MINVTADGANLLVRSFLKNTFRIHLYTQDKPIIEVEDTAYSSQLIPDTWRTSFAGDTVLATNDYMKFEIRKQIKKVAGYFITNNDMVIWKEDFTGGAYHNLRQGDVINIKPEIRWNIGQ